LLIFPPTLLGTGEDVFYHRRGPFRPITTIRGVVTATLLGYDEFILREVSTETLLAASSARR
jgi:hypothetical protein